MLTDAPETKSRPRRHAQGDWLRAEVALGAVLLFCPLAIATVHPWAVATAAGLSLLALGLTAWAALRSGEPFLLPAPSLAFAAVVAFIGLQLVPLPPPLVGLLAPSTRELFDFALGPLGRYPAWRPLSLDPPATARELAKAVTCLAVFLSVAQIVRSRRAKARVVTVLGVAGLLVALIGFGHALWGASALFGVFAYEQAHPPFLSTFGNPNHLSAFLGLAATVLLGKVLAEKDRKVATLWGFAYLAAGVGVLLSLSRGGIVAFAAAQLMLAVAVWLVRKSEREGVALSARAFVAPGAALLVIAVSAYLAWDALAAELATADSLDELKGSKLAMWPTFLPLLRDHWLVGVGRGAFEAAYQRFVDPGFSGATFTHPENLLAQWLGELGVPLGLALLGACAWALVQAVRRGATDVERLACAFAVAAVALHDLVDFALELGGVAVPATAAFAVAVFRDERPRALRRRAAMALVPAVAALVAFSLFGARRSLAADGQALAARFGAVDADALAAEAAPVAERHPADYFPHLLVAQAYARERPLRADKVVGFANRAMYLNPTHALPHTLAARALLATGRRAQARVEYRLAFALRDAGVIPEIARAFPDPAEMADALPDTPAALVALADHLLSGRRWDAAAAVLALSVERHGDTPETLQRQARVAGATGKPDEQLRLGVRLSELAPEKTAGLQLRIEALLTKGQLPDAIALLEGEGLKRFPTDAGVVLSLARLRLQRGDTKGCREALKRLPGGGDLGVRLAALSIEAQAAERDGQGTKALALVRQAVTLRPDDAGWRWHYAQMLERFGRFDQALREAAAAAERAPRLRPEAERLKERVEAKKKELEELRRWKDVAAGEGGEGAP